MSSKTATINLLPKQTEAWEYFESDNVKELGYGGAAGGGKTRLGCYLAIYYAEKYPGSRGAIGRKELKILRLTTLTTMWEIFAELGYKKDKDYKYNAQDGVLKFTNGSEVLILDTAYSPQDPEYTRFGSLEITWAWIDESNETPIKGKQILKTRVGRKNKISGKKVKSFWLETFNPDKGHVYSDYYKPWKEGKMPDYRAFVPALPGDNPHLPEEYIDNLRRADKITKQRLLYGNFEYDDDPALLFEHEAVVDLWTNTVENGELYLTADIARFGKDFTVIGIWDGLECIKIVTIEKMDTERQAKKIREILVDNKIPYSHCLIDEDGIGGGVLDNLKGAVGFMGNSIPYQIFDDRKGMMVNANFRNLRSQCYFKLADLTNNHQIAIRTDDEALQDVIRQELEVIKQKDPDKDTKNAVISKEEIKEYLGHSPDYADMLMMRMMFLFTERHKKSAMPNTLKHLTISKNYQPHRQEVETYE